MTNEKRLIDANATVAELKENVCKNCNSHNGIRCDYCWADDVIDFLKDSPTVDAVEVVHGHWIVDESGVIICSQCGAEHEWQDYRASFCEDCGAKMDGGNEDV